ncbi:MAG TPA: hypothetical protein VHC71_03290 [Hyphomicrobium sp.]|jgi:hypothetical protein|nr:hypothetical protein [Hyphomicrobium sp.]
MRIPLQNGRKITDATYRHVEIELEDGQKIIFSHSDVVQLLKAMNVASTKAAIADAQNNQD